MKTVWTDRPDEQGLEILRQRLGFEADVEFGLRSRVGRTLELSRVAVASVEVPEFDTVADLVVDQMRRLDGSVTPEAIGRVEEYLRGMLERYLKLSMEGLPVHEWPQTK